MSRIRDKSTKERAIKKVAKRLFKFERGWEMKWIELSSDGRQDYINEAEKILSIPELAEGLELLEKVRQGTTVEAIIVGRRKRPPLILSDE